MSVVDLLGIRVIDAAAAIVPGVFLYAVGIYGFRGRKIRLARGGAIVSSKEPERREWLALTSLMLLGIATMFASLVLMGVPLT